MAHITLTKAYRPQEEPVSLKDIAVGAQGGDEGVMGRGESSLGQEPQ